MGRKLDALLGRNFRTSKFQTLTKLAISRAAILKNQRQARHHHAKSDVVELLKLGHQQRALLRVEHVIKDRNMMDAFVMIEEYCHLVSERVALLEKHKECPDELQAAVSSLIFASSRCGEFPELLEIRAIFASRFGKEFVARAIELRNNCPVNPKIIQKFSVRQASLESRLKVLKEIASEHGITLQMEEETPVVAKGIQQESQNGKYLESDMSNKFDSQEPQEIPHISPRGIHLEESFSESVKLRKKYTDVAAAALDAFESAAYAAEAARAAVELSKSESQDGDQGNGSGSGHRRVAMGDSRGTLSPHHILGRYEALEKIDHLNVRAMFDQMYPTAPADSGSEGGDVKEVEHKPGIERISSTSSSDSEMNLANEESLENLSSRTNAANMDDTEAGNTHEVTKHDRDHDAKPTVPTNEQLARYSAAPEEDWLNSNGKNRLPFHTPKRNAMRSHEIATADPVYDKANYAGDLGNQLKLDVKPISARTRRVRGN